MDNDELILEAIEKMIGFHQKQAARFQRMLKAYHVEMDEAVTPPSKVTPVKPVTSPTYPQVPKARIYRGRMPGSKNKPKNIDKKDKKILTPEQKEHAKTTIPAKLQKAVTGEDPEPFVRPKAEYSNRTPYGIAHEPEVSF